MFPRSKMVVLIGGGNRYLLDDEFRDTLAAGAVNGTTATPGPGTRTVVDTESKLSLSGGKAVFSAGKAVAAWGDPSFSFGALTRTAGRVLLCKFTESNFAQPTAFIVGSSQNPGSGGWLDGVYTTGADKLDQIGSGAAPDAVVASLVDSTTYIVAVVLRANGAYTFIKGGTFTNWTYLFTIQDDATATLYPTFSNRSGDPSIEFIRVPAALWLPTPLAYDTFTRANGALGSTEAVGPDDQGVVASAWTNQQGTVQISGNTAIATALDGGGRAICTVPTSTANVLLDANLTKATTGAGIVLRYQDSDNYVYMWHNGANLLFVSRAGGIETTLVNAAAAYGAGRTIRGILSGTSGSSYYNNAQIGATQVVPASAYGVHGLIFFDTDSTLDVFQAFPRGTSNEYSKLDTWSGANP